MKCSFVRGETVAGRIEQPRVIIRALHAGEQAKSFARKFSGSQGTGVRERTVGLALLVAGFFPILEVPQCREFRRILHPLDYLQVV